MTAYLHAIGTAVPDHDIHQAFIDWARRQVAPESKRLFDRMAARAAIGHRWSVLPRGHDGGSPVAAGGFYAVDPLPGTEERMAVYADAAPALAMAAIAALRARVDLGGITHLVVASCTGFVAPGIDQIIAARLELPGDVERLLVGFMGCYAAVAALRSARHIVRSDPAARVLVVTVELSTLHLQASDTVEPLLAMLQFGDGAAAALVVAEPGGFAMERPFAATLPDSAGLIRWAITDRGFAMHLSGDVPGRIAAALAEAAFAQRLAGGDPAAVDGWAVHAGGRSILDAVEKALALPADALAASRRVLADNGNMSSATLMFVLADLLAGERVDNGVALAFGPGLAAEGFGFPERGMNLAVRAQGEELMDADDLAPATYAAVVGDLAQVNTVTLAARPTLAFLDRLRTGKRLRLLDVGFGDGDTLRRIARWAARRGVEAELVGIDLNPRSAPAAAAHTPAGLPIRYLTGDHAELAGQGWDAIVSSLVAHHMTRAQLVAFLRFMEAEARAGWLVNDLHRHRFAHAGFPLLARIARWHPIVRHDGTLSIARSYRPDEWPPILAEAGITDARVFRAFPFRLCVERRR